MADKRKKKKKKTKADKAADIFGGGTGKAVKSIRARQRARKKLLDSL